jgi:hypothetical protein
MTTLMGQPIETWLHVVETGITDPTFTPMPDQQMLLLLLHEAILLLKRGERSRQHLLERCYLELYASMNDEREHKRQDCLEAARAIARRIADGDIANEKIKRQNPV